MKATTSWFVYILRCADGTYYTGVTKDIRQRITQHNTSVRGAKYTRSRRPVTLAYQRRYRTRSKALQVEASIKSLSRLKKIERIRSSRMSKKRLA